MGGNRIQSECSGTVAHALCLTQCPNPNDLCAGGKLEFRKAQDVVAAAMRTFLPRHPHARLLLAWHNPWHQHLRTIER
jgi:hypothetical protein